MVTLYPGKIGLWRAGLLDRLLRDVVHDNHRNGSRLFHELVAVSVRAGTVDRRLSRAIFFISPPKTRRATSEKAVQGKSARERTRRRFPRLVPVARYLYVCCRIPGW